MTKTGETQFNARTRLERGLLLAASLAVSACSLAAPEKGELFAPSRPDDDDAGQLDAAMDEDGGTGDFDSGATDERDSETSRDAGAGEDAEQDAGPTVFQPEQGLVVHYRFNETTGNTVNDFAGDKDALIVNTPDGFEQWVAAGHADGALKLSGSGADGGVGNSVELPQGILLGLPQCSISLWLNRAGGPMWQRVFDFGSGPPVWLYFTALGGTGLPVVAGRTPAQIFVDFMAIPDAPAGEGVLRINQPIPVGTWVHFVLTWSASEMVIYLNGKQVAQAPVHGGIAPTDLGNTGQNYLGRSQFEADPYFNGMIDEFRIYDRVLSPSDVAQLHALN